MTLLERQPVTEPQAPARRGSWLFAPIDISSIVVFRIAFGLLMMWEGFRYIAPNSGTGISWTEEYFILPEFLFKYYGFTWVKPWPGSGIFWHMAIWILATMAFTVGYCYRFSATVLFVTLTYFFLLDQATYLNHMYLICLFAFLMIFIPANRAVSVDADLKPSLHSDTAPAWALWLLRFQMAVPYIYGGIAKLNGDYLLYAQPLRQWLSQTQGFPLIGRWFDEAWMAYAFSYAGVTFDLLIVPALLWRKSRPWAFATVVLFHVINSQLFKIGVFPWLGIAATTIFFAPSWPRDALRWFRMRFGRRVTPPAQIVPDRHVPSSAWARRTILGALGIYVVVQVLVPLRHLLYPGDSDWTYEGHRFSWRMKLHDREAKVRFTIRNPATGETKSVDLDEYLASRQARKFGARPDMVLQLAHHLAKQAREDGIENAEVYAKVAMSLNGRKPLPMVDSNVDLAHQSRNLRSARWLLHPKLGPPPRESEDSEDE